jgi:hypothetical protein
VIYLATAVGRNTSGDHRKPIERKGAVMSAATAITIILVVAFLCGTLCFVVWLLVSRFGGHGFRGAVALLVPGQAGENRTEWEPFVIAPAPHDHDEAIAQALADHVDVHHGPHQHDDLATRQEIEALRRQLEGQQTTLHQMRRHNRRLRVRVASLRPFDVIGAVLGAIVGGIVVIVIPSRLYSYPTITHVTVNGSAANVTHQLAQNHWVLGGIILAGVVIGFVIGRLLQYVLGRTEVAVDGAQW